jgi:hypothetical protein
MGHDIAQRLVIGQLPGAGESNHKGPAPRLNRVEIGPRRIGGIRHNDHFLAPGRQDNRLEHLAQEGILRLILWTRFGFDQVSFLSQRFCLWQILGVKAFGEPAVEVRPQCVSFVSLALWLPEAREAGGGAISHPLPIADQPVPKQPVPSVLFSLLFLLHSLSKA